METFLKRFPESIFSNPQIDILIVSTGVSEAEDLSNLNYTNVMIMRSMQENGFGEIQKFGYRFAIEKGFAFIINLFADGWHPPELIPRFIEKWYATDSDVILGSRLKWLKSPLTRKISRSKRLRYLALIAVQNALTNRTIMDYQSEYRGYATSFLRKVPFEINTNKSHFGTEILLQAFHIEAKIEEIDITFEDACSIPWINSIQSTRDILDSTIRFKMHQFGMLCDLKYRRPEALRYREKAFMAYSTHKIALSLVRQYQPQRILDIGSGPGFVAKRCRELGAEVIGLDLVDPLPDTVSGFQKLDFEKDPLPQNAFHFDIILLLDIIEHLSNPEKLLIELRNQGYLTEKKRKSPIIILSTPNVAFFTIRLNLLFGRFNYAERGILDITHKRLFTRNTLLRMLQDCGYFIEKVFPVAVPFDAVMQGKLSRLLSMVSSFLAHLWPCMFAFQFLVVCHPKQTVKPLIKANQIISGATGLRAPVTDSEEIHK
ncbi:MAG: methyltransferase domain-containing protein [Desulfobacterales bacterium]|nr:methyltransferase domain-containing protein [Desulfobacterales bacterium]